MASTSYPNQITVRVSDEEKRQIERKAEAAGMSVSRYLAERGTSEDAIREVEGREEEAEALVELRREIAKIGVNVNQIARHAHYQAEISEGPVEAAAADAEEAAAMVTERLAELYD